MQQITTADATNSFRKVGGIPPFMIYFSLIETCVVYAQLNRTFSNALTVPNMIVSLKKI